MVLFGDDLITDAEIPTERQNRWTWLEKAIDYLGPADSSVKYVGVGTVLDKDNPISWAKRIIGHVVHHFRVIAQMPADMDLRAQCEGLMLNAVKGAIEHASARGEIVPDNTLPSYRFYLEHRAAMDAGAIISWLLVCTLYSLMRRHVNSPRACATDVGVHNHC
ncbi:hypothetical protein [Burkholderia sp. RS02]|uniref:hypothetical protein n=1 Tax=unclassified Burkholderia TaxID=2613784 RepID=UPI003218D4CF